MNALNTLVAKNGIKIITTENKEIKEKFSGFLPSENCVVTSILDKNGNNIIDKIIDNPTEELLPIVITAPEGQNFYGITLLYGKVALILEPLTGEEVK